MNKFKEFDWIETPEQWINDLLHEPVKKKSLSLSYKLMIGICLILFSLSSLGVVYAYNENFRLWLNEQFQSKEVIPIEQTKSTKQWRIENQFLYYYHEDKNETEIIDEVYIFENGKFVLGQVEHIEGKYLNQEYSFDYVRNSKHIFTYHHKGFVEYSLNLMNDNIMYFGSSDMNLFSLDLQSQTIKTITNDNDSVNFAISPQGRHILINKNDKYWTVYNVKTGTEKRVDGIDPYAHSNEYSFLDDNQLIAFNGADLTCVINLNTLETNDLGVQCLYPAASTFTTSFINQKTEITNHLNKESMILDMNLVDYRYAIDQNRYLIFDSYKDKKIIIVDFEQKKSIVLDYIGTNEIVDSFIYNDQYLIISNNTDYYITSLSDIFK